MANKSFTLWVSSHIKKERILNSLDRLESKLDKNEYSYEVEFSLDISSVKGGGILIMSIADALECSKSIKNLSDKNIIVLYDQDSSAESMEIIEEAMDKYILGFIESERFGFLGVNLILSYIQKREEGIAEQTGEHLGKVLEQSLLELQRVKKLHEKVVPIRQEKVKGVSIYSKFAAGFSSGGEFFDIKKGDNELIILLTSAKSYVASSVILGHFEEFQKKGDTSREGIEDFLEELIDECRTLDLIDREDHTLLQLDVIRLDLRTYEYEGFHFGKGRYYSDGILKISSNDLSLNENSFEQSYFKGTLRRGQKLIYLSPGTLQNFEFRKQEDKINKVILEQFSNGAREILNEAFFQLKKDNEEDFLKYDASIIYVEVDPNAFIQV